MRTTLKIPAGILADSTLHAEEGRWVNASNVRFSDDGEPMVIRGWESVTTTLLNGVCRTVFPWTDNTNNLTLGFGTHNGLQLWQGGGVYDITPTLALPSATLTSSPLSVTAGSNAITVTQNNHGLTTSDTIALSGSPKVGRQVLANATVAVNSVVDANTYTVLNASVFTLAHTLAANSVSVTNASAIIKITDTAHNLEDGCTVTIANSAAVGGITPNGSFPITVVDSNTFTYFFTASASSTAVGGGSGVVVTAPNTGGTGAVIAPQRAYTPGQIDGTGGTGWSTGAFGVGGYGLPSLTDYYPRTWSMGAWGQQLLANFRDGSICLWANDLSAKAQPLANSPARVNFMIVVPANNAYQVFALGCSEEASGKFNPMCIRHSSIRKNTEWNTSPSTTAREYTLTGGGRIVAGRMFGSNLLVWTNDALWIGSYVGNISQPWKFDRIGTNCGLIGPNAVVVSGRTAFWISPDRQFYSFSGGAPTVINNPLREEFAQNLARSQSDKIVASSIAEFGEVRWDYPDGRDGYENSRYLLLKVGGSEAGVWSKGEMARTAMVDAGPSSYPCGVTYNGNIYWHERGTSADGAPFSWFIESADQMIGEDRTVRITSFWPDFKNQLGPITLWITTRFKPQGAERTKSYAIGATDEKTDVMAKGRYIRLKFSGNSSPTSGRLGAPVIDLKPSSRR